MEKSKAFSYSRLNSFEQCPRRFWYYQHLPVEKKKSEIFLRFGSAVHEAIEKREAGYFPQMDSVIKSFHGINEKTEKYDKFLSLAREYIEKLKKDGYKLRFETKIGIMKGRNGEFRNCDYENGKCSFRGIIDLIAEKEDIIKVVDWKTGAGFKDEHQLLFYGYLLYNSSLLKGKRLFLSYCFLENMKFNWIEWSETHHAMIETWVDELVTSITGKDNADMDSFERRTGFTCKWCFYKTFCCDEGSLSDQIGYGLVEKVLRSSI